MKDLVIDLETYGLEPGCIVLSIGALQFDAMTGEQGAVFYRSISVDKSLIMGFNMEEQTVDWWKRQGVDAYLLAHAGTQSPETVLKAFSKWIETTFRGTDFHTFGNSARFDLGILHEAYRQCKLPYPIDTFLERDYRTLTTLNPWTRGLRKQIPFEGLKHDPVCDCRHEAKVISAIYQRLNLN